MQHYDSLLELEKNTVYKDAGDIQSLDTKRKIQSTKMLEIFSVWTQKEKNTVYKDAGDI